MKTRGTWEESAGPRWDFQFVSYYFFSVISVYGGWSTRRLKDRRQGHLLKCYGRLFHLVIGLFQKEVERLWSFDIHASRLSALWTPQIHPRRLASKLCPRSPSWKETTWRWSATPTATLHPAPTSSTLRSVAAQTSHLEHHAALGSQTAAAT